ncbi:MAG TPA: SulP family inorganic anion transporter [Candidatus Sulfotelmatobacter sp.]|nr:SulP family inorganic anion transporter [Candidatus Sulfotelmatobacter sp.]
MPNHAADSPDSTSGLRLFQGLKPFRWSELPRNLLAGVTLAAMNIPQSLGYTRIAGMPVITGLYTLLLPLLAFAIFGSSRYLVVAADSATAAILAGSLAGMAPTASTQYVAFAGIVALLTGVCLLLARLLKLGFLADFLSQTVLVGFLTGVGFQVGIAVLGEMLGIEVHSRRTPMQFVEVLRAWRQIAPLTLGISVAVIACIFLFSRFAPKWPGPLFAVAGAMAAGAYLHWGEHGVKLLGPVPGGLPHLGIHGLSFKNVELLTPVALSCFVMIVAQSAATARAYATRHNQPDDENADLVGLGVANALAAFSGTFVVNGSPTQTGMVESAGGTSQMAHLATAAVVALVLLFLTHPLQYLPQCVLGAVVFTIAVRLIDFRAMRAIYKESPGEYTLAAITAAFVVLVGVEQGIVLAMALSLFRVVRHSYRPHSAVLEMGPQGIWQTTPVVPGAISEPGIIVYRFSAPLFYANANRFSEELRMLAESAPGPLHWILVDAGAITNIDFSAARQVEQVVRHLRSEGIGLAFAHVRAGLRPDLDRHHLTEAIGPTRLFDVLHEAVAELRNELPS